MIESTRIRPRVPGRLAVGLLLLVGIGTPAPSAAQNEVARLRSQFEQALVATQQGRYDDAKYLLREVDNLADQVRDWSGLPFVESARYLRRDYVRYLTALQRGVIAIYENDEREAARAADAVGLAQRLAAQLGRDHNSAPLAELQTGLATSIAKWGGWEPYSGSFRSEGPVGGGGGYRSPQDVENERRDLTRYIPAFGPNLAAFDAPPPKAVRETKYWYDAGRPARIEVEFEALSGSARRYLIEVQAWDGGYGYVKDWEVGRAYQDHDDDGRDDGQAWSVEVPESSGQVVWNIDWDGHPQWPYARWRVSSLGPSGWGIPGPWRSVDWSRPNPRGR